MRAVGIAGFKLLKVPSHRGNSVRVGKACQCKNFIQNKALRILTKSSTLFQKINNETLEGCYHQTLIDVLENLWDANGPSEYMDLSLVEYVAASYHFEQAEHSGYLANVENNLGFLLYKVNHCQEAHEHLDQARRIFASLKKRDAAAQVDETRARVFLKEKRKAGAEKVARASVRSFRNSDRQSLLAEALTIHGTAVARLGQYGIALASFRRALDLCEQLGNLNRIHSQIHELHGQISLSAN